MDKISNVLLVDNVLSLKPRMFVFFCRCALKTVGHTPCGLMLTPVVLVWCFPSSLGLAPLLSPYVVFLMLEGGGPVLCAVGRFLVP